MDAILAALELPAAAHALAALPLPGLPLPALPPPSLGVAGVAHPRLHAALCVSGLPAPLIHEIALPPLSSPCRACRALALARGAPTALLDLDRAGCELGDGAAAPLVAWGAAAAQALGALRAHLAASPPLPPPLLTRCILLLAPLTCFAPWTHPALAAEAQACLAALGGGGEGGAARAVNAHAPALLEWARGASAGGAWRAPGAAAVRHLIPWLLARLSQATLQDSQALALALPLALRLCDDWEATSVWCGLSALAALLATALPTALLPWAPLIQEALQRAGAAGAATQHPTLALALAHTRASALAALRGACPPPSLAPLARAAARRGAAASAASAASAARPPPALAGDSPPHHSAPTLLFEGPWDAALEGVLQAAGHTPSPHVLYALLHSLPPLLLGAGPAALARLLQGSLLPLLARAACPEQLLLAQGGALAAEAGAGQPITCDARLPAAALHALRVLALVLGGGGGGGGGSSSGDALLLPPETLTSMLAICLGALLCVSAPRCARALRLVLPMAEGGEGSGGAPPRLPSAPDALQLAQGRELVLAHVAQALAELQRAAPARVQAALLQAQRQDAGLDAALRALPLEAAA